MDRPFLFLSYSQAHNDSLIVDSFASRLNYYGLEFFRDTQSIQWGDDIPDAVYQALDKTTHFVPFISQASEASQWVFFEIGIAYALKLTIIPRILNSSITPPIFLANSRSLYSEKDENNFINKLLEESKIMYGELKEIDNKTKLGTVQPPAGQWAHFRPGDVIGPITFEKLRVGDILMFVESPVIAGSRSRYVTNVRLKHEVISNSENTMLNS